MNLHSLPFRLGASSYIIPADILPNARYLAGKVRDMELILFEVDDGQNNLPSEETLDELIKLAALYDMTYTVHLPLDLKLGADGSERDVSLEKARKVIELTRRINPWAYVLHLDGKEVRDSKSPSALRRCRDQSVRALELAAAWAGSPQQLAVENLEGYPPDFLQPVLEEIPVSRCVDIGHLWLDGVPVVSYLKEALPRTRVIHAHGIAQRDHAALSHVPAEDLDAVMKLLLEEYRGVFTMEVFSEPDFLSSVEALRQSAGRIKFSDSKITLILGGARSGKSAYAQRLARESGGSVLYVATATAGDEEMKIRIENHRAERPPEWRTLEAPLSVGESIARELSREPADVVLLDCLTLLASNLVLRLPENASELQAAAALEREVDSLLACAERFSARWLIVSNEVGLGLVPPYPLGRIYRDALGRANQKLARRASRVVMMTAGIPVPLKP